MNIYIFYIYFIFYNYILYNYNLLYDYIISTNYIVIFSLSKVDNQAFNKYRSALRFTTTILRLG